MAIAVLWVVAGALAVTAGEALLRLVRGGERDGGVRPGWAPGLSLGVAAAVVVAALGGRPSLAAGIALGAGLAGLAVALPVRLLAAGTAPSPGAAGLLLPGMSLLAAGIALANPPVTAAKGAGVLAVFLVETLVWHGERRIELDRASEEEGGEDGERAEDGGDEPETAPPARPRRGRVAVAGSAGVALALVGAVVLVDGGVRAAAHSGLSGGFLGTIVGACAGLGALAAGLAGRPAGGGDAARSTAAFGDRVFGGAAAACGLVGVTGVLRPFAPDGASTVTLLAVAVAYAVPAAWFLARGRGGRALAVVQVALLAGWFALAVHL